MQKRIMALLLALCLSLTCTLGALAGEPVQTAGGQALEATAGENTPAPTEDELTGQDGTAPQEDGNTPDAGEPGESESQENGSDAADAGNAADINGANETNDADGANDAGDAGAAGKVDGDADAAGEADAAGNATSDADVASNADGDTDATGDADVVDETADGSNAGESDMPLDSEPSPMSLSEEEWQEKAQPFYVSPSLYDADGNPVDTNNIAVNDVITFYYTPSIRSGNTLEPCTIEDIKEALGASEVGAYGKFVSDNASAGEVIRLDEPKTLPSGAVAYWKQDVTVTAEGRLNLHLYLTATVDGAPMEKFITGYYWDVRKAHRGESATKLYYVIQGFNVNRLGTENPQDIQFTVGEPFTLQLEARRYDLNNPDVSLQEYIKTWDLDPSKVSVTWRQATPGDPLFEQASDFKLYEPSGGNILGTQTFTVTAAGFNAIVFSVLYDGDLVTTGQFIINAQAGTDAPDDDNDPLPTVQTKVPGAEAGIGYAPAAEQAVTEAFNNAVKADSALDSAIREAAKENKTIITELTIQDVAEPADAEQFAARLNGKLTYKDISIKVKADGEPIYDILETQTPIGFAFDMPEGGLIAVVLRNHGSEGVTRLPCWVDNGKVCFSANKFSTYAIGTTNDLVYASVQTIEPQTYNGKPVEPAVKILNAVLDPDDYVVTYENNAGPGRAKAILKPGANGKLTGSIEIPFDIVQPTAPSKPADNNGGNDGNNGNNSNSGNAAPAAYHGTIPQTADEFPLGGALAVFGVSLAGLGALLLLRKKQR